MSSDGRTKKQEIDLISQYAVSLRERCGVSFYVLQQENRNSSSAEKIKMEMTDCSADGLKDSGNTLNDQRRNSKKKHLALLFYEIFLFYLHK